MEKYTYAPLSEVMSRFSHESLSGCKDATEKLRTIVSQLKSINAKRKFLDAIANETGPECDELNPIYDLYRESDL